MKQKFKWKTGNRYQVITYDSDSGGDDKRAYRTIREAERVAQGYLDGTEPLSDGLCYEGAIVYDRVMLGLY